ncbi:MAG TPA: phosphatase PAP2 family protein [Novosphingobium sp.]
MPRRSLTVAGVACWLAFAGIAAAVHGHATEAFDHAGLTMWRAGDPGLPRGPAGLIEAMRDLTALGGPLLRNLIAAGVVVALLMVPLRHTAVRLSAVVIGGWLVDAALKALMGRPRPTLVPHLMAVTGNSFPCGHSFNAATVYLGIALACAGIARRAAVRRAILATACILSLLVSFTRVWLGVHYPTDVIAGWLGGTGWALLAWTATAQIRFATREDAS